MTHKNKNKNKNNTNWQGKGKEHRAGSGVSESERERVDSGECPPAIGRFYPGGPIEAHDCVGTINTAHVILLAIVYLLCMLCRILI
jgi:hypothetical protein